MGYRFVFGPSGSGKSTFLQRQISEKALESLRHFRGDSFLFLVPEQYTMETQKELVAAGSAHGIMNIDVLSFGRLTHRIFEEVGVDNRAVLGDIGKTLLIHRLAEKYVNELPVIGAHLKRQGYTAGVKSVLSEFLQYDITPADVARLADYAAGTGHGALGARLRDLGTVYTAFQDYKKDVFVTSEETLDLLAQAIPQSELIRNSVIIFDGYTGFTPVQYRVIEALFRNAREVVIALTLAEDGGRPVSLVEQDLEAGQEEKLGFLTRKTVRDLTRIAQDAGTDHAEDIFLCRGEETPARFAGNPSLAHLEKHLFRYPVVPFAGAPAVRLSECSTPETEVRQMFIRMKTLIRERGYAYRDFAVVTGDLATYADPLRRLSAVYRVPVYVDAARDVRHDPFVESIRSVLGVVREDFSYESVFRYLRSGLSSATDEETDLLENWCLARGIRGRKRWMLPFDAAVEPVRRKLMEELSPLTALSGRQTAGARTKALYGWMCGIRAEDRLSDMAAASAASQDDTHASEYGQIYRAVIQLLDQIYGLLGDEPISAEDYAQLLEAGFDEIRVGILPQQNDVVLAGDLERSRLTDTKVLFVLGANDGAIPKGTDKGGLLSDLDREFLRGSGVELAPSPREEMFTQRFYLYLNFTKPSDGLEVSLSDAGSDGKAKSPSYIVRVLAELFPDAVPDGKIPRPEDNAAAQQLTGMPESMRYLAGELRRLADGSMDRDAAEEKQSFLTVYGLTAQDPDGRCTLWKLRDAAFRRYHPESLQPATAEALYHHRVRGSVSRLEDTAQCYLQQFLKYGLSLRERDIFKFDTADTGTVLHNGMETFAGRLRTEGSNWRTFTPEQAAVWSADAIRACADVYGSRVLHSTARREYEIGRLTRILLRTVLAAKEQILGGSFDPAGYEFSFGMGPDSAKGFRLAVPASEAAEAGTLTLRGRIDRFDLCRKEDRIYVKIVDYKSGDKDLDPDEIAAGRQLQLLVYMEELLRELHRETGKETVPAAMFYVRLQDPLAKEQADSSDTEKEGRKKMRPTGMLSGEEGVLDLLAGEGADVSEILPIDIHKTKHTLTDVSRRRLFTESGYADLRDTALQCMQEMAQRILAGDVSAEPFRDDKKSACTYCPYADACGFDPRTPGFRFRKE